MAGASDWVTAGTIYTGTGIVAVVAAPAAPVVASVAADAIDVVNEEIILNFADNPQVWRGTMDVVQGILQPTSRPMTPEGFVIRLIVGYWATKH